MRSESNKRPQSFAVERVEDSAMVYLYDNIREEERSIDDMTETFYAYEEYRITVPYRDNLEQLVKENKQQWLELARNKEYDECARAVREKRDAMLAASDREMCIDRFEIEVPTGSTFSAWLSFLVQLGKCMNNEWAAYRQKLRDIPQQDGFPFAVQWPKEPGDAALNGMA